MLRWAWRVHDSRCIYVRGQIRARFTLQAKFLCCFISLLSLQIIHFHRGQAPLWQAAVPVLTSVPVFFAMPFPISGQDGWSLAAPAIPARSLRRKPGSTWGHSLVPWAPQVLFIPSKGYGLLQTSHSRSFCGLVAFGAFLKAQLVSLGGRVEILLFAERKRMLKSVALLYAGKRQKDSEG